ncbi:MAG: 30S ribosomal protein S15 [Candidatus Omnitrophica bacterium]|nr:30S ribosomal protein S15 [Candidatus Omnitrophota bacterium]MDD5671743.1 30S ribosomal protein S15 [Candidatus Omnitrophota bacterium]
MPLAKEKKKQIISDYKRGKHDTGSAEIQVALLTERINSLSEHFKKNVKDHHSRYGLIKMVSQRKKLLTYIRQVDPERYQALITRLELRK